MPQSKVEELIAWCRRDPNAGCKVIPASSTRERNDLDDLVMQRTMPEMQQVWRALAEPQEKRTFIWLVTTVAGYESAPFILRATMVDEIIERELLANEEAVSAKWSEIRAAEREFEAQAAAVTKQLQTMQERIAALEAQVQRLDDENMRLREERALARDRMVELENVEQRHVYLVNDLRAALGPEIVRQLQ